MKKVTFLFLATVFFIACSNNKTKTGETSTTSDTVTHPASDNPNVSDPNTPDPSKTDFTATTNWSVKDRNDFLTNCIQGAVNNRMDSTLAVRYCNCMMGKLQAIYPDVQMAAQLTDAEMESPAMVKLAQDCLK